MAGLASHILGQSNQYPLYPALPGSGLDTSNYSQLQLPCLPDLLLLPSDLNPFAKLLNMEGYCSVQRLQQQQGPGQHPNTSSGNGGTPTGQASGSGGGGAIAASAVAAVALAVNPGRLAKGAGGGTFAHMWVTDGSLAVGHGAGVGAGSGGIAQRCRVEIRRI